MNNFKKLGWVSFIFLAFFLLVSLPSAQCGEATGNAPIMVASQEATIPLTANALTGATESDCPYTLTFKLAAVALHREDNKSENLMPLIGAGDLNLGWAPGMDASLMLQNECYGIELRYLGLHQWDESKTASYIWLPGLYQDGGTGSAKFRSALHNAELNLHWWPCANDRYSLLMGFRWFQLRDRLSLSFFEEETNRVTNFIDVGEGISSRNDLYGGQVGVEGLLFGQRDKGFSIDGSVKAGVFANRIRNKVSGMFEGSENGIPESDSISESWNRTKTAFLSEVVLNANYAFTKNIAMAVGYEFLYVNKVAVPVNELSTQSVIFQGGRMGLNVAF